MTDFPGSRIALEPAGNESRLWTAQRYDVIRVLLGLLLLLTAALKGHQLTTGPVTGIGILTSRWFLIAAVEIELLLGLWLLFGVYARLAWTVSVGCFILFANVSESTEAASTCLRGRLSDEREWFVQAPVELLIEDGKVTRMFSEAQGLAWLAQTESTVIGT